MSNAVVVMPALKRPEMLAISLERMMFAQDVPDDIRIFVDHTTADVLDDMEYVRDTYCPDAQIFHAQKHVFVSSGCWNILNALKAGYEAKKELIFLIEEDVSVFPDYFAWNLRQDGDHFATCGRHRKEYGMDYYTNPGAAFRREALEFIVPHINDLYFRDQRSYLDATFGSMDEASPLDDGLIRRVIRQHGSYIVYPETPKVAHQGFHYYNRLVQYKISSGSISERIASCRAVLDSVSPADRYSRDFEPYRPLSQAGQP